MVAYRRAQVAGGCYFLTLTLQDRRSDLLVRHGTLLRQCLRTGQRKGRSVCQLWSYFRITCTC